MRISNYYYKLIQESSAIYTFTLLKVNYVIYN